MNINEKKLSTKKIYCDGIQLSSKFKTHGLTDRVDEQWQCKYSYEVKSKVI